MTLTLERGRPAGAGARYPRHVSCGTEREDARRAHGRRERRAPGRRREGHRNFSNALALLDMALQFLASWRERARRRAAGGSGLDGRPGRAICARRTRHLVVCQSSLRGQTLYASTLMLLGRGTRVLGRRRLVGAATTRRAASTGHRALLLVRRAQTGPTRTDGEPCASPSAQSLLASCDGARETHVTFCREHVMDGW